MKEQRKFRVSDIITVLGLLLIIYGFAAVMLFSPDREYSDAENRYLQSRPKFSLDSLVSGKFTADVAKWCTDQMPLRDMFVGIKGSSEIALGKAENNSVILGDGGNIIAKTDFTDYEVMDRNTRALQTFAEKTDANVLVAVAPRSQDILHSYTNPLYPSRVIADEAFAHLHDGLAGLERVDLRDLLGTMAGAGDYVYYRTDHHWTTLGAYYAYTEIVRAMDITPYPLEYFTREVVSEEFYGTTWSKAGMKWVKPDSMEFFRFDGDTEFVTEITDSGEKLEGFYDLSYLDKKDKYSTFIGGNNGRVKIYLEDGKERETLVLIKDSFGHSLAPFLAMHFDLDIIDLRYYKLPVSDVIAESGADTVLIMYNLDSFVSSSNLTLLTIGQ